MTRTTKSLIKAIDQMIEEHELSMGMTWLLTTST